MDAISQTTFFNCTFSNENVWNPIKISLRFVSKGPISNIPALVQIMAWRRRGDKPLSEPMMVNLWRIYASFGLNELRSEQNDGHVADNSLIFISLNEICWILIHFSLKFVPKDSVKNDSALVQMTVWRWTDETSHYLNQGWPSLTKNMHHSALTHCSLNRSISSCMVK